MVSAVLLFTVGGVLQVVGVILVAWPDMQPWMTRASKRIGLAYRRTENRVRKRLELPLTTTTITVPAITSDARVFAPTLTTSLPDTATRAEKLDYLILQDQQSQRTAGVLANRITALETEAAERFADLRQELMGHTESRVAGAASLHRPLRVVGAVLLVAGVTLQVLGSLA